MGKALSCRCCCCAYTAVPWIRNVSFLKVHVQRDIFFASFTYRRPRWRAELRTHDVLGAPARTLHRAPVGQGRPSGPGWLATALGIWSERPLATGTVWAGLCLTHHHHHWVAITGCAAPRLPDSRASCAACTTAATAAARVCSRSARRDRRSCLKSARPTGTCLCLLARSPGLGLGLGLSVSRCVDVSLCRCRGVAVSRCRGVLVSRCLGVSAARSLDHARAWNGVAARVSSRSRALARHDWTRHTHVAVEAQGRGLVVVMRVRRRGQRRERTRRRRWLLRAGAALRSAMFLQSRVPEAGRGINTIEGALAGL